MRKEPLEEDLDYIARYPLQYEQLKDECNFLYNIVCTVVFCT